MPEFDWEYCECGCHGLELNVGPFYRWALIDFPKGVYHEERIVYLRDGHRFGNNLGTFKTFEECKKHVMKELKEEAKKMLSAIETLRREE